MRGRCPRKESVKRPLQCLFKGGVRSRRPVGYGCKPPQRADGHLMDGTYVRYSQCRELSLRGGLKDHPKNLRVVSRGQSGRLRKVTEMEQYHAISDYKVSGSGLIPGSHSSAS